MKYAVMYLICGFFWALWLIHYQTIIGNVDEVASDLYDSIYKDIGSYKKVRKLLQIVVFIEYMASWPVAIITDGLITKINKH